MKRESRVLFGPMTLRPDYPTSFHRPWGFVVPVITVAAAAAVVVAYLGLTGTIGGTIPGTRSAPSGGGSSLASCEGKDRFGAFHFTFIAGVGGGYNFNGTQPGPCVAVQVNSSVNVTFQVSVASPVNHSWVLIPAGASSASLPAFPGAGYNTSLRTTGIPPGAQANFSFQVTRLGLFQYICEVPGHEALGMVGWFNVTNGLGTTSTALTQSGHAGISGFAEKRVATARDFQLRLY